MVGVPDYPVRVTSLEWITDTIGAGGTRNRGPKGAIKPQSGLWRQGLSIEVETDDLLDDRV